MPSSPLKLRHTSSRLWALVRLCGGKAFLLYYLLVVAGVRSPLLVGLILLLLASPLVLALRKLPPEIRALLEVGRSDEPVELIRTQDALRREGVL